MLEQYMKHDYQIDNYQYLNDRFIYIDYVNRHYDYRQVTISPVDAYRHQGNLYSIFGQLGIPPDLYPFALYLNGYTNPSNYDGKQIVFKVPVAIPIPEN